jgi:hypothetical protein
VHVTGSVEKRVIWRFREGLSGCFFQPSRLLTRYPRVRLVLAPLSHCRYHAPWNWFKCDRLLCPSVRSAAAWSYAFAIQPVTLFVQSRSQCILLYFWPSRPCHSLARMRSNPISTFVAVFNPKEASVAKTRCLEAVAPRMDIAVPPPRTAERAAKLVSATANPLFQHP